MDFPKDGPNWFGEGFEGFPRRLPEDCVEYMLFIIDSKLTQKAILTRLELVRKQAVTFSEKLLRDYIWQREGFQLKLEIQKEDGLMFLQGLTNYGDSVEDEWLIVYILRELSRDFPDLWIKVTDSDGEFLLIEAANALPRWLNPEIADNRVWINSNSLRIIPLATAASKTPSTKTEPLSKSLTLLDSYNTISKSSTVLIHSPLIEAEAFYRLRNYPAQISDSVHHSIVTIPRKLASILHNCPASIAPAIEAFYLRDPVSLKPLLNNSSHLVLPPTDLVTTSIKFTKVLFAQAKSQQFPPPPAWSTLLREAQNPIVSDESKQKAFTRLEIGMKVTSGFEMLLSDSLNSDKRSVRELRILLQDIEEGSGLPTDTEISSWPNAAKEDSEEWLNINFEDFENELQGKNKGASPNASRGISGQSAPSGFGDAKTQADLKKMVQRFEDFLNDEDAGLDGAELDDMDFDDDEDEDESEDEDKEVSFDENEFARMMREMMGLPPDEQDEDLGLAETKSSNRSERIEELSTDGDDEGEQDEAEEMRKVMQRMEAELIEAGALDLDPTPSKLAALKSGKTYSRSKDKSATVEQDGENESDEELNIDFNLAKNLLESFKSQAGSAGPGGNLIGMMGLQLPRDEDDLTNSK